MHFIQDELTRFHLFLTHRAADLHIAFYKRVAARLTAIILDRPVVVAANMPQMRMAFGTNQRTAMHEFILHIDTTAGKTMQGSLQLDIDRLAIRAYINKTQVSRAAISTFALPVEHRQRFNYFVIGEIAQPLERIGSVLTQRLQQGIAIKTRILPLMMRLKNEIRA